MLACWILWSYLAIVNLAMVLVVRHDKRVARRRGRRRGKGGDRVPERGLLMAAVMGGGLGGLVAFAMYRHKTRKLRFLVPYCLATLVGAALAAAWLALLPCSLW